MVSDTLLREMRRRVTVEGMSTEKPKRRARMHVLRHYTASFAPAICLAAVGVFMAAVVVWAAYGWGFVAKQAINNSSGTLVTCDQNGVKALVHSISQRSVDDTLRGIMENSSPSERSKQASRHITSPGNERAASWLRQQYRQNGLKNVSQQFEVDGQRLTNAVARLRGNESPGTVYTAGAHLDSISEQATSHAPGANDNATGLVATLEASRALKAFQPCLKSTLEFANFNDEEVSMLGSTKYIDSIKDKDFRGLYNVDMLGLRDEDRRCIYGYYNEASRDKALADQLQRADKTYGIDIPVQTEQYGDDDQDGARFWDADLPAVFVNQCGETDSHYHRSTDTLQHVDTAQVTKATRLLVASLAELGMK